MNEGLSHIHQTFLEIKNEMKKTIIGQDELVDLLIVTMFSGGHALLEWVPGLGKTKTIRTISKILDLDFKRISFTPDLLPSDVMGAEIYKPSKSEFSIRKWPIFTNILLADEINRTPPKVQSALLEAMEEKQITLAEKTLDLPDPFFVFATQNPLEHEGTYPLPEAQLDRFFMKIILDYPHPEDEKNIFKNETKKSQQKTIKNLKISSADILEMIDYIEKTVYVDEKIYDYVSDLISATRALTTFEGSMRFLEDNNIDTEMNILDYGASTRAGLALIRGARVFALLQGRDSVLPEDVKFLMPMICGHRIGISYEGASEGIQTKKILDWILDNVVIPS